MARKPFAAFVLLTLLAAGAARAQEPDAAGVQDTTKRTDVSAQDSPEDRGLVVETADHELKLRILGSIRVFGSYDFEGLPRADAFSPLEIPVPEADGVDRYYMDARQTRIGFETTWTKSDSSHTLFARIEADFAGSGNTFRLRHAYIRIDDNRFILGQTWTAFTDITAVPLTVDLDGPASSITLRSTQVRYTHPIGKRLTLAGSVESPSIDVLASSDSTDTYQSFPDIIGQVRYIRPGFRAQGAVVFRMLSTAVDTNERERVVGSGVMGSMLWDVKPGHTLGAQLVMGRGISRYVTGISGRGFDLQFDPDDDSFVAPLVRGAYASYSFSPRPKVTLNAILGGLWAPAEDFYPPTAYHSGGTLAINTFFPLCEGMLLGFEGIYGRRENLDGQRGDAVRVQARATYDF